MSRLTACLVAYAMALAFFAVPVIGARALGEATPRWLGLTVGIALCAGVVAAAWYHGKTVLGAVDKLAGVMARAHFLGSPATWLGIGFVLRLAWSVIHPVVPVSDGISYVKLAERIFAGGPYHAAGLRAYWPPGYPIFLAPWIGLVPWKPVAIAASNLALFLVGGAGILALGRRLIPEGHVRIALALYAIWPNLLFQAGLPEKELVLVALLPWVLHLWLRACADDRGGRIALASGALFGYCCLVQPGLLLLPLFLAIHALVTEVARKHIAKVFVAFVLGAALVISPWTYRNWVVLGEFVPISTNGGGVFYYANNPLAIGGWADRGAVDLSDLSEVNVDSVGRRLAMEWIMANPGAFLRLGFEKNLRLMGDDAVGAYQALRREGNRRDGMSYSLAKALCNVFWLGLCGLILCGLLTSLRTRSAVSSGVLCLLLAFAYTFLVHGVVESVGKYHVLWSASLALLACRRNTWLVSREPRIERRLTWNRGWHHAKVSALRSRPLRRRPASSSGSPTTTLPQSVTIRTQVTTISA